MKIFLYLLLITFCLTSCKKEQLAEPDTQLSESAASKLSVTGSKTMASVVQDTIPPAGAVDAKTYGALGNGVHDDTQALQNIINAKNVIVLTKGTYIINQTLYLRSGVSIYGTNGATIKSGTAMTQTLLTAGRYFSLNSVSYCSIINLTFLPSTQSFTPGAWTNAAIFVTNSSNNSIKYNSFKFKQSYKSSGIEGVWISGVGSTGNYTGYNKMYTVGIEYAEGGASNNIAIGNYVENSHSDGMSAHGNATTFSKGNSVINNTIVNAGHMGIEDWGKMDGTLLKGNTVTGSGKSPTQSGDGIGMSMVGVNTVAVLNTLSDAKLMYMEVGGNNNIRVDSNLINDASSLIPGIVVNFRAALQPNAKAAFASIDYNTINNCWEGIAVEGDYTPNAKINGNKINNSKYIAITVNSNSALNVAVTGNQINYSKPNVQSRNAIVAYTNKISNTQMVNVSNNTVTYNASATGGTAREIALLIGLNNITYSGNKVYGNNILSGKMKVLAISSNGNKFSGIKLLSNTFSGTTVDLGSITISANTSNVTL